MTTFPRTILVGHDFSKRADRAVRRARQLSEADSRTVVFHAASEPRAIDALKDRLASRVGVIMAPASDARITVEVLHDVPHAAAKRLAEEHQVDLLVMGLHGKKRILEIFRTSTLNRMISALDVPTLIARTSPPKPYRHILVGIDFAVSSRTALDLSVHWFPEARITAAHAFAFNVGRRSGGSMTLGEMDKGRQRWLDSVVAEVELPPGSRPFKTALLHGPAAAALRHAASATECDLVVLGRHQRGWPLDAIVGSVARGLLADPPCDVLIVPPTATPPRSS